MLQLQGGPTYAAQMGLAAEATQVLATSQATAATTSRTLGTSLSQVGTIISVTSVRLAGLAAGLIAAFRPFAEAEQSTLRAAFALRAFGSELSFDELSAFADQLQRITGLDDDAIISLGALGAQFGLTRQEILRTIPVVADLAVRTGRDLQDVFTTLIRATRGRPQGLIALGIDPARIRGDIHDINNVLSQVGDQVKGLAALNRDTLGGSFRALLNQIGDTFEAFGAALAPVVTPIINFLNDSFSGWELAFQRIRDYLVQIGLVAPGVETKVGGQFGASAGIKGDPEQTELMRQTARNTEKMTDAVLRQAFGGAGSIRGLGNIRSLNAALRGAL